MIRQQSAWIMNGKAVTACQIMGHLKAEPRSYPTDPQLYRLTLNWRFF